MTIVTLGISPDERYLRVWFKYDEELIAKAKRVPSGKLVSNDKELGRHFQYRADTDTATMLRYVFGEDLKLEPAVKRWFKEQAKEHFELRSLSQGEDAVLENLPLTCPELSDFINGNDVEDLTGRQRISPSPEGRPYQRADIKFLATVDNGMNANQPGLGKTEESIAATYEEQIDEGPKLVICPRLAVNNVWVPRLQAWTGEIILGTTGSSREKLAVLEEAQELAEADVPFWLVINWSMVRAKKIGKTETGDPVYGPSFEQLTKIIWNKIIADEWHREGLANTNSVTREGLGLFVSAKREALSGTPVRGNVMKLWGCLNWLEPKEFSARWRFAEQWLEIEEVETGQINEKTGQGKTYKKIHGIIPDREEAFFEMLSRYMCRRTKEEVLPWLPKKQYPDVVWVEMTPRQKKQYEEFAINAEVKIEEERLSATSILAEYARLKQFANAYSQIAGYDREGRPIVVPTEDSPKLEAIVDILETLSVGERDDDGNKTNNEKVVIFSQFSKMVDMVDDYLQKKGYRTAKITGAVKDKDRDKFMHQFQFTDEIEIMLMTTTAGGVSIELDAADTVIFLDETWVPDDQEQAEDRTHRGSRAHQVTVWYIKTKDTIEHYIEETNVDKRMINRKILDLHRAGFRAVQ